MQQMPEEGHHFQTVDRHWRDIMKYCAKDPKVRKTYNTKRKQELLSGLFFLVNAFVFRVYTMNYYIGCLGFLGTKPCCTLFEQLLQFEGSYL